MSFKYLNLKLGIFTLGLVAFIALLPILSANEQVSAATPAINCSTTSGQDQACINKASGVQEAKSDLTAWAQPVAAAGNSVSGMGVTKVATSSSKTKEADLHASNHLAEALALFAIALGGIAFLGRRRKVPTHRN